MEREKHIDEGWKEKAAGEKQERPQESASPQQIEEDAEAIEIDFINYVTSLSFQAMIFLGIIPNPLTNQTEKNTKQAKFLIDTLSMLKEKTVGNLSKQEEELLTTSLYELQMRYVETAQGENKSD